MKNLEEWTSCPPFFQVTALLAEQNVDLIATAKKNMKPRALAAFDKLVLRKRSIVETVRILKKAKPIGQSGNRDLSGDPLNNHEI